MHISRTASQLQKYALYVFAGLVLIAVTGAAQPAMAAFKAIPQIVNTSKTTDSEAETAVAINQLNPQQITIVSNRNTGAGTFHAWSTDGGLTWQNDIIADNDALGQSCCDAQLASDEFGNIFLTYLSANIQVKMAVSTDGGATFKPIPFLSLPLGQPLIPGKSLAFAGQAVGGDQPSIAAAHGSVWVSWTSSSGKIQASGAAVTGLGLVGTFSPAQSIPGSNNSGDYGDTSIGPDGQVYVVYQTPTGGEGPATILGALDPDGLGPQGFQAAQVLQTTNVGGFDFIPAQSGRSIDAESGLAWDRTGGTHNGRLYLVYVSEQPQESNDTDIQIKFSDDNGTTWSNPVRVNDDTGTNSQFNPRISLDQTTGLLGVAWYDCRNDLGDHGKGDTNGVANDDTMIYASVSRDGGLTFQRNKRLSAGASDDNGGGSSTDYGDYSGFSFFGGTFYFAAADNSNSTGDNPAGKLHAFDLYTAPVSVH
jgi:hypothetical protein